MDSMTKCVSRQVQDELSVQAISNDHFGKALSSQSSYNSLIKRVLDWEARHFTVKRSEMFCPRFDLRHSSPWLFTFQGCSFQEALMPDKRLVERTHGGGRGLFQR